MIKCKLLIILISVFYSTILLAKNKEFPAGKIVRLKGKVTVLRPHTMEAVRLKEGDFVYEDSSILATKKSFVKIKLIDDSILTIGPSSKAVVVLSKQKSGSIITLLKGTLRAKVQKNKKKQLYIKTKSAAMGVRGTEFMVIYNEQAKRTSLLTYSGNVAMKKISRNSLAVATKNIKIQNLKNYLDNEITEVKLGDFSSTSVKNKKISEPVKIDASQFTKLKLDDSLGTEELDIEKKVLIKLIEKNTELIEKSITVKQKQNKNGGVIATSAGLYIPPFKLNGKKSIIGKVASDGTYIPPKGHKVDPIKGVVHKSGYVSDVSKKLKEVMSDQLLSDPENPAYRKYFE
ncbi:MAG: FecR domain-containing protein [Bacteriovoracaceae bacterium]|jgi:hypothetical protein|nr:FecR domain-containing protein [Bacteriovoracaceae bacterium]